MTEAIAKTAVAGGIGLTVGAQVAAALSRFQPALGEPLFSLPIYGDAVTWPLYAPWELPIWFAKWHGVTDNFTFGLIAAAGITALPIASKAIKAFKDGRSPEAKAWGGRFAAMRAGLLPRKPRGTVLGKIGRRFVSYAGEAHGIIAGASDAGKTTGPVFGTLLTDTGRSVISYDPKAEMYAGTARWRSTFSETLFFDPTNVDSVRFNPLAEIQIGSPREIAEAQNVASVLVEASGLSNDNPIWPITASELLTAVILYVLHSFPVEQRNLGVLRENLFDLAQLLPAMKKSRVPECKRIAETLEPMSDRIRDSITATARATLSVFADPIVCDVTSKSDFRISDIVCSEIPFSLYLQVRQSDERRLRPLMRLILSQITMSMLYDVERTSDGRKKRWRVLYLLDEFPGMGKIEAFLSEMRQFRGYGITAVLIMQSLKDLRAVYGRDNSFLDICKYTVVYASGDPETQRDISAMLGTFLDNRRSVTKPRDWKWRGGSETSAEDRKPLMDTGKVRMLDAGKSLVLMTGVKPIQVSKAPWFNDRLLRERGTNLRAGEVPPGQNSRVMALRAKPAAIETARVTPVVKEATAIADDRLEKIEAIRIANGWSKSEAARKVFPRLTESRARKLLAGTTPIKDDDAADIEKFLGGQGF